jgi:hypothetical protein
MSHCERLPNGVIVRVTKPLTDEERAALAEYMDWLVPAAQRAEEKRRAALTDEERVAEDERRERVRRRLRGGEDR